ncbi:LysR family transcriptional regulator [Marinomonas rhizomae]|uniref:LysR family transcriptional regulator n=1 Tax=Marinomonas rhizomae TaxID=491948 RepID=A0A366IXF5_9GAMM|nr:LysR family transcriptional regulator [Marinomonas rhizomae]RBP79496.1 LysR family transcriptional regulator [Marinomonas rhizomae]RNF71418.1 LysR family transcriptional regulator [Marinomonas rhizomae]
MKKRLPPLNWLRSFEASARHLNFTQAANELNLTQAAISQQVKSLESQLGTTLFKRLPRGLALTDAGLAYMPAIHDSIGRLAAVTDELFGQGQSRQVTIRVSLVFFTTWLAPKLPLFYEQYPDIRVRFTSNIWKEEKEKDTDLDIRYGRGIWSDVKAERLTWDELFPVCSPDLIKDHPLPLEKDLLSEHRLLHVLGYEEGWGYWLNQTSTDYHDKGHGIQFDTLISALEMAKLGQGFALGRTSLVSGMLEEGCLIAPFEDKLETSEAFFLTHTAPQFLHPNAEIFKKWVLETAQKQRS